MEISSVERCKAVQVQIKPDDARPGKSQARMLGELKCLTIGGNALRCPRKKPIEPDGLTRLNFHCCLMPAVTTGLLIALTRTRRPDDP
jgi:hypothetical protein